MNKEKQIEIEKIKNLFNKWVYDNKDIEFSEYLINHEVGTSKRFETTIYGKDSGKIKPKIYKEEV